MSFEALFMPQKKCKTYIVSEIGGNFHSYTEAAKLVDAAKEAGVDCVKLQTYTAQNLALKNALFDMENTGSISQYEYFKKYELSKSFHRKIFRYIESKGLDWFSTPSHFKDVDMLESLKVRAYKIGADDAVNIPLLRYVAKKKKPIFLSTGMCTLKEIEKSVSAMLKEGNTRIVILHTVSEYPTHPEFVNLNAIKTLQKKFPGFIIGFSDHTVSTLASMAAVTLGARVIERHFTLNKNANGPDHMLSSTPNEMKDLIKSIRIVEKMLGNGIKSPIGQENKNRLNNRKSLVTTKEIKAGERFTADNISIKRPGRGLSPEWLEKILKKKAKRDINRDVLIVKKDFS
ncbi:MAG: N-acetylneuraminate synthase family protein [Candidatus Omnitrophica bacterium]|nr:N-acetylneuraminate synthase family protein [Candidatus Omnitrophota bacterium]